MGAQESKLLQKKPPKSKSSSTPTTPITQDISDFITQLSTLACIRSTNQSTFQYVAFNKLPFTGHYAALPLCSTISTNSYSVFVCYDCSTDDHAYLCQACFEKGNHDSHRFSVFPNNDNWRLLFCRCGDQEYMKKKTLCQTHVEIPVVAAQPIDRKDIPKFSAYFNQTFRVLFSLMEKNRAGPLLNSVFSYLEKLTNGNLYFSKIVCEFFLQSNITDEESSNLRKFVKMGGLNNSRWYCVFRSLNFASEYKIQMLREIIGGINQSESQCSNDLFELVLNFAGKVSYLNSLAKDENIIIGNFTNENKHSNVSQFYELLIKNGSDATQIWKCLVRNNKVKDFVQSQNIMKALIINLLNESELISSILSQLLRLKDESHEKYILACLMIQNPDYFIPNSGASVKKITKTSSKSNMANQATIANNLEKELNEYYSEMFFELNTHSQGESISSTMLLLLPNFSFGEELINKFWNQVQKRVEVITKNKEKKVIKQASMNFFGMITRLLEDFMKWDHNVLRKASEMNLKSYTKDAKLVQKILVEYFDQKPKNPRLQLLQNVDIYTQKQRSLAKNAMKVNLRYNAKKGKYYNISKKLPNNCYNFEELNIGAPLKFTQWQEFVSKKFFTEAFYRLVPNLIKVAQKALMEDIEMVKTVSNISVCICLLNKTKKQNIKEVTRNFIKEIPDVREDVYYVLAKIRDRLELDIDDAEETGKKGSKKPKLDLITEIRDKKFRQIKQRQQKMRLKWLKQAEALQSDHDDDEEDNICNICKEKDSDKRRFVYPCNFTRNNVISTLLHSEVTDLDINICLHKVHEDCFEKERRKGECPVCKFDINCYIPEKPLADESYTKNWLRNFENIITTINMQSGKSFNSDWATIFLTYLIYSRSFKVLLKSTEVQRKQREKVDELLVSHYKSQLEKWPELTKQAIKRAQKTVKGQVSRQSTIKKIVKTLTFELMLQEITAIPVKNVKRVEKKFRELINAVGTQNAQKINECFVWSRDHESIQQVFTSNVADEVEQLFKIRQLPEKASEYLSKTSIKCPMCNKYQPTTWQCLFCSKISCQSCMYPRNHCQSNHKGSGIILHLSNAQYEFWHESREVQRDSLYRNQYEEGWTRNENSDGWVAHTEEIYSFFDTILHSLTPFKKRNPLQDNSDNEGEAANRGWGFGNNQDNEMIEEEEPSGEREEADQEDDHDEEQEQEQNEDEDNEEQEEQEEEERPTRKAPRKTMPAKKRRF